MLDASHGTKRVCAQIDLESKKTKRLIQQNTKPVKKVISAGGQHPNDNNTVQGDPGTCSWQKRSSRLRGKKRVFRDK